NRKRLSNFGRFKSDDSFFPLRAEVQMVREAGFMRFVDAWNFRKVPFAQWDKRGIGDFGIRARRRRRAVFYPLVHVRDQRAPVPLDGIWVVALLRVGIRRTGIAFLRRERRGKMLQAGKHVDANIFAELRVL